MTACVLFDFDGTLTKRDTTRLYVLAFATRFPLRTLMALPHILALKRSGPDPESIQAAKFALLGKLRSGFTANQLRKAHVKFARRAAALRRKVAWTAMREHARTGRRVLVVTASARDAVELVFEREGVEVIGTEFALADGRFTGELDGIACYGEGKRTILERWAVERGGKVEFVDAWSDSLEDLPMMGMAQSRHWVCPPAEVGEVARIDAASTIVNGASEAS